jgi:hypothetical protein
MSQLIRGITSTLGSEIFLGKRSHKVLLRLLGAAILGGAAVTHGQEVLWGRPVAPSAELVQQAGSNQEVNIQQLMKRYNISRAAATERFQDEQTQRDAQEQEQAARPVRTLDTLIATYGVDQVENALRWMTQKKGMTRDQAAQEFIADPEGWRRQEENFERDIIYAPDNQAAFMWMTDEMKMSDAPQRLVADPEGWKQRYQQHLQQIDAEQEQGRKASAQALGSVTK